MKEGAERGLKLLHELFAKAKQHHTETTRIEQVLRPTRQQIRIVQDDHVLTHVCANGNNDDPAPFVPLPEERIRLHLGAWHNQATTTLTLTADTQQNSLKGKRAAEAKGAVADFCVWLQNYVGDHVVSLQRSKSGLCPAFRDILLQRPGHFEWLKQRVAGVEKFCHPFYSTFTPIMGFTPGEHTDTKDGALSILLNFWQHAVMHLADYNCDVEVQPYDIVLFKSNEILHSTRPHPSYGTEEDPSKRLDRWAVSCYLRNLLEAHREPIDASVFHFVNQAHQEAAQVGPRRSNRSRAGTAV